MPLKSHGLSDKGCVRTENEDRISADDSLGLYIVCDGLGGRRAGEIAAQLATDAIRQYVEASHNRMDISWPFGFNMAISLGANRLLTATRLANRQVWRRSEESLEHLGMATTITALLVQGPSAVVVNVGDTRAYLLRDGALTQLTVDDTATPTLPPGIALSQQSLIRGVLTNAAGSREDATVHVREQTLADGDRILLCSDGLYNCIDEPGIVSILESATDLQAPVDALINEAKSAGAPDNVSAILIEYSD